MSLLKMTILSYNKIGKDQLTEIPQVYIVMFNPNSYKTELKVNYDIAVPQLSDASQQLPRFTSINSKQFAFDFIVDGTGAAGYKRNVSIDVGSFIKVVGYDTNLKAATSLETSVTEAAKQDAKENESKIASPGSTSPGSTSPASTPTSENMKKVSVPGVRYLLLMWGTFIQKCVIESISVNYTLFSSLGSPLRATISATFREYNDEPRELPNKNEGFFDKDPVQGIMSVAGLAYQVYNTVDQTVAIAKANDLDSIRESLTGDSIKLPF